MIRIQYKPSEIKVKVRYMSPTAFKGIKVETGAAEYIIRQMLYKPAPEACNE